MGYGPEILDQLSRGYTLLHDSLQDKGVNVWYGEAGGDPEVARMLLDNVAFDDIRAYLVENYGDSDE